jgi:glycogen synthase
MRILFISNLYPPYELGGYEQWCSEIANKLIDRGHEISVLTSLHEVKYRSKMGQPEVTRSLYLETGIDYYRPLEFFFRRPFQEKSNIKELSRKIDQFRPDVILVWGMWNLSRNIPFWAEKLMPGRVLYFISSYWPMDMDPHKAFWQLPTTRPMLEWIKRPFRGFALNILRKEGYPPRLKFEHAVCCSKYVRDTLVKNGKIPEESGVLLGGIDPEPFLKNSITKTTLDTQDNHNRTLHLLYFGRLSPDKGVHTAVEALGILKQRGLHHLVELTIVGGGHPAYEAELREMVAQLDLEQKVRFTGHVPREEIPVVLGQYDVYLFTSIWPEPMARSVMEAMAAGLLVIGTEVGGQSEMIHNCQNALTFKAGDGLELADRIKTILDNKALGTQLARAGQEMVLERFTLDRMAEDIEQFCRTVLKREQKETREFLKMSKG